MKNLSLFDNFKNAVCAFSKDNELVFKNKQFLSLFGEVKSIERFKKQFNFNICSLSSDNFQNMTPLDMLLKSKEPFHTICSYQKTTDKYSYFYIYTFFFEEYKIVIFEDVTAENSLNTIKSQYEQLNEKYNQEKENKDKFLKLQEHAQLQVLKMGIINKISLIIQETNDIETILTSTLKELNDFTGGYKTYFSTKEKNGFKIRGIINSTENEINTFTEYENDIISSIKNKKISYTTCLKEYSNAKEFLPQGTYRIIIPVYNKNKLLGIIVIFTKHKFSMDENKEILQSISVQLASSLIQSGLIEQLNKKNKKLEKTLTELKETQIQLINTEKMASVGQLVSGVAHEINTPLSSISSNNKLIQKLVNNSENITGEKLNILKELNNIDIEAANRISEIVKSLKRFVRLDEAEFQEADINNEIDLTLKLTAHEINKNIEIEKIYSKIPPVKCAVNMLNQVFMNLIVNACHSINETKSTGKITIQTEANNQNLTVKIKDTGTGIKKEEQNKIFNVGYTTKPKGIGTGLGLSISKKIIELHRGSISFTSEENIGTEFTVSIPLNSKN